MANEHPHNDTFEERCAGYVLQALDEDERKTFEQLLENATEEQQRLYQKMQSAANQPSFTKEPGESPESLKKRLMAQVESEEEAPSSENEESFNWATFSAAASFALLILSLSLLFYSFNLSSKINDQQAKIAALEHKLSQKDELLGILESREVDMVLMSGLEVNPDGYGKVIWDSENRQALLQVSNLPAVPPNKAYQLWIIRNNEPVSAGVFAVKDSSNHFFRFGEMSAAREDSSQAFAVTMEPKGGMPQPTGEMYLLGNRNRNVERP